LPLSFACAFRVKIFAHSRVTAELLGAAMTERDGNRIVNDRHAKNRQRCFSDPTPENDSARRRVA